jgi:hypothetical protein
MWPEAEIPRTEGALLFRQVGLEPMLVSEEELQALALDD